jgi:hypothetical protein
MGMVAGPAAEVISQAIELKFAEISRRESDK